MSNVTQGRGKKIYYHNKSLTVSKDMPNRVSDDPENTYTDMHWIIIITRLKDEEAVLILTLPLQFTSTALQCVSLLVIMYHLLLFIK
jgi:hypothetical protein